MPKNANGTCTCAALTTLGRCDMHNQPPQSPDPRDERIAELEREFNELHDMHVKVRTERDEALARVKELEGMERRARTYEAANTKLIAERDAALARVQELERQLADARSENYAKDFNELHDRHVKLVADRDQLQAENGRLKEALEGDTLTAKRVNRLLELRDELQAELERKNRLLAAAVPVATVIHWQEDNAQLRAELQAILRQDNTRGYPTGIEWLDLVRAVRQVLNGEKEKQDG